MIYEGVVQLWILWPEDNFLISYIKGEKNQKLNFPHIQGMSLCLEVEKLHHTYVAVPICALPIINPEKYGPLSRILVR